jgi:hypothetical protein
MTATDENGRFRFERICQGPIRLQAGFRSSPLYGRADAEAGQQDVKIFLEPGTPGTIMISDSSGTMIQSSQRYVSLIGKPLNQVKGLELLTSKDATGKPLLILFMDQQQRPSRRAVLDLTKQTDQLREKGIKVVVAQVNKLERTDLDQWLEDEDVKFEAQILEGDFNKQQYAWGVKALPWLILTDKNHVVTAEGFNINELEEKITTLEEK